MHWLAATLTNKIQVWIHQNKLRIIPRTAAPTPSTAKETSPVSRPLTLDEARKTITLTPEALIHSPLIEEEAFYRLRNYPTQISASMHHSSITIPRKLAYILHELPASVAPAVEAFYLRDPISLRLLEAEESDLAFPPKDLVTVSTRFTRILFAQLKSQEFPPPTSWKESFSQASEASPNMPVSKHFDRLDIGMKVTSGFEMMTKDSKNGDNRTVREMNILLDDLETDEGTVLPTNEDIENWRDVNREDSESWLDINFEDFQRELEGKNKNDKKYGPPGVFGPEEMSGFGDAKTQADLKKMVERFEAFLNDEDAGIDGVELDGMDYDDDDDDDDDDDESEDEDKDVSFDEKEFARMMREMMGMPSEEPDDDEAHLKAGQTLQNIEEVDSGDEGGLEEVEEMRQVMQRMEAELNEAGAFDLNPTPRNLTALKGKSKATDDQRAKDSDNESDEDVNIDFNLAKNLLESFKSQAGMSGPGGNLMAMMGMQLPRDEDDVKPTGKKS